MSKQELLKRVDEEIDATRAFLDFWREQQGVEDDTLGAIICALMDGYEAQLKHLEASRAGMAVA
jgi:hypothetical protein